MAWRHGAMLIVVFVAICGVMQVDAGRRREDDVDPRLYKAQHSFRSPFFIGGGGIPFWEFGGNAMITDDAVRLTDNQQSRKGFIWNVQPLTATDWEVTMELEIGGGGRRGADGLAFWYAREQGIEGPVYGSKDQWHGLGVFLDTFDNDNKRDNPSIRAMLNDGTKTYDHGSDGITGSLGAGCGPVDFRNQRTPFKLKVAYVDGVLSVQYDLNTVPFEEHWVQCIAIPAQLPIGYHFGISAATGGLTDQHDVKSFITYSYGEDPNANRNEQDAIQQQLEQQRQQQQQQNTQQNVEQQQQQTQQTQQTTGNDGELLRQLEELKKALAEKENAANLAEQQRQLHVQQQAAQQTQQTQQVQQQQEHQTQATQTVDSSTSRSTLSTGSAAEGISMAEFNAMKLKLTNMENLASRQADLLAALVGTVDAIATKLTTVATKTDVSSISSSTGTTSGSSGQEIIKAELAAFKKSAETENSNTRNTITTIQQHLGPLRSAVDQMSGVVNSIKNSIAQQSNNAYPVYTNSYNTNNNESSSSSSYTSWIIFIVIEIIILGGFAVYMRRRNKKERHMY